MRSPAAALLVVAGVLGAAAVVMSALILGQIIGLRSDLNDVRADVDQLSATLGSAETHVTPDDLEAQLADLEAEIGARLAELDGDPASGDVGSPLVREQLREILDRIQALDDRVTEICDSIPVC